MRFIPVFSLNLWGLLTCPWIVLHSVKTPWTEVNVRPWVQTPALPKRKRHLKNKHKPHLRQTLQLSLFSKTNQKFAWIIQLFKRAESSGTQQKKKKKNLTWIGPANVTKSTQEKSTLVRGSCFMRFKKGSPDERLRPSGAFASHRLCWESGPACPCWSIPGGPATV
jgi:hypothetical protein